MKVIVDIDPQGNEHWIDTDPANYHQVEHPDNVTGKVDVDVMLAYHNQDPLSREIGGWHEVNQLPGETMPLSRWQRLVRACNHPDAHPQAKALGLKE